MSASIAAARARDVQNQRTAEAKLDKLAEAVDFLARAVDELDRKVKALKGQ